MKSSMEVGQSTVHRFQQVQRQLENETRSYVIVGFTEDGVILADPEFGWTQVEVSGDEFEESCNALYAADGSPVFRY